MATLLSIECVGAACSTALVVDGQVRASARAAMTRGHASALVPQIAEVMAAAACTLARVDTIVTPIGPGSFTGLRVGLATAQGLALALGARLWGVRVSDLILDALATAAAPGAWRVAAMDGKRPEPFIHIAAPNTADAALRETQPITATAAAVAQRLAAVAATTEILVGGDGAAKLLPLLNGIGAPRVIDAAAPDAAHIGLWAAARLGCYRLWRQRLKAIGIFGLLK
ncbi:MAG: tRNA (adenosine(37)-N6)-threonylcarbamoyltransferase complex dimerization subunit type 1 TsaB, partial [Thalassobaculaceae bacterium]